MSAFYQWIKAQLLGMSPEQSLQFHDILHGYSWAANKYGLWTAASIMKENGCTDDGFIDFRAWLIAQGKETYIAALENPDSLAGVEQYGNCEFESLSYVGDDAYEELTGRSAYGDSTHEMQEKIAAEISVDIRYHPMIEYPLEIPDAVMVYPKLGAAFAKIYNVESFRGDSMWNIPFPEVKALVEMGSKEARKLKARQKRKAKANNRDSQPR